MPDHRDCTLGRSASSCLGCLSPLVPSVFGALLDDVATCSWARGVERWIWDRGDRERERERDPEDEADTEACSLPRARRSTGDFSYEAREGAAGHSTLELAALPFAIDRLSPPTYRWALGRACVRASRFNKSRQVDAVGRPLRVHTCLAIAKGESVKDHADARVRGSRESNGITSHRGRIPVMTFTREIPT